jgi:hypothetical protein
MKIIFEYEDGTYRIIPNIDITKLHESIPEHGLIARFLSDRSDFVEQDFPATGFGFGQPVVSCKNKYMIANDNRLAGFGEHKDKQATWKNIQYLEKRLSYHRKLMDELNKFEDLSVHVEKLVEERAIDEIFEYAKKEIKFNVHTN